MIQIEDQTEQYRANTLRSDFIANASHELRTPLASIIGYIETLRGHAKDDPEAREHFLGIMEKQAARMRRLVDDLMSLSRIELSEHVRPGDLVDLHTLAREAAAGLEPQRAQYEARLTLDLPDTPMLVKGDRDQLVQVLVNLIDNGMKYGGDGAGVTVQSAGEDTRYPGMVGITVVDSGPGIAREHIPRLTERFYRVSAKQSMEKGGTGLGLAIVKHIVKRHMGDLAIESTLGQGSRFTLWFPMAKGAAQDSAAPESIEKTDA
nr:ATP-binding protein [Rubricella aquisinus]